MPAPVRAFFSLQLDGKCANWSLLLNVRLFFRLCFSHSCHDFRLALVPDVVVVHVNGCHPENTAQVPARDDS